MRRIDHADLPDLTQLLEQIRYRALDALLRSSALAATPACSDNPATFPTWSSNGSLQSGRVCRVNTLRPACGPTAMRYVMEWPKS